MSFLGFAKSAAAEQASTLLTISSTPKNWRGDTLSSVCRFEVSFPFDRTVLVTDSERKTQEIMRVIAVDTSGLLLMQLYCGGAGRVDERRNSIWRCSADPVAIQIWSPFRLSALHPLMSIEAYLQPSTILH